MYLKYQILIFYCVNCVIHGAVILRSTSKGTDDCEFTKIEEVTTKYAEIIPTKLISFNLQTTRTPGVISKDNPKNDEINFKYTEITHAEIDPVSKVPTVGNDNKSVLMNTKDDYSTNLPKNIDSIDNEDTTTSIHRTDKELTSLTFVIDIITAEKDESSKSSDFKDFTRNLDAKETKVENDRQDLKALYNYINRSSKGELSPFIF